MCQGGTETPLYGPSPEGSPGRPRSAPEPADTARTVTRGSGPRGLCYDPNEVRPRESPASGPRLRPSPPTLPLRSGFARCPLSILAARRGPRLTARRSRAHFGRTVRGGWGATPRLEGTDRPPRPVPPGARHLHVSAGHLHRLFEHFQAHRTREAAEGVSIGRGRRQLRGSTAGSLLRRRHLAAEERRSVRERTAGGRSCRRLRTREGRARGGGRG